MLAHHRGVNGNQLGAGLVKGDTGRKSSEQLRHPMRPAGHHRGLEVMGAGHDVRDDLGVGRVGHRRLEDADNRGVARTETDGLADHGRIAVERDRPEPVREDGRARCVRPIVLRVQQAPEDRAQAHDVEERPTNHACLHHARLAPRPISLKSTVEKSPKAQIVLTRDLKSLISGTENVVFSCPMPGALCRM